MQDLLTDYLLFRAGISYRNHEDGSPWDHVCVAIRCVALPFANGERPGGSFWALRMMMMPTLACADPLRCTGWVGVGSAQI